MPEQSLKTKTVNGVMWSAVERFSTQGMQFVFNILIARMLLPEDYGVIAMLGIFLAVAQTFIDSGFGNALIRKNNCNEDDYNTVFYFNLVVSILFCGLLWITAPWIASFYDIPLLVEVTRTISITLVIGALSAVHNTQLAIELDFKKRAIISICTIFAIGSVGLWMAMNGYGVWALVAQNIVGASVRTGLLWIFVHWYPKLKFSWHSFKEMFSFGSKLLATSLIDTIWGNLYNIVIGKCFAPAALGNYNRAESFASFPSSNIYGLINSVLYPSLCKLQEDKDRLKNAFSQFVKMSSFVVFPLMIGLAAVADPFIRLVLTDKWAETIPLLQLLCFSLILYPISAINITFPNILGHSDYYFKSSLRDKGVDLTALIIAVPFGLKFMCLMKIIAAVLNMIINAYYTRKLVGYGVTSQLWHIRAVILHSVIMGILAWLAVEFVPGNNLVKMCAGIFVGMAYYIVVSFLFMKEEIQCILSLIRWK